MRGAKQISSAAERDAAPGRQYQFKWTTKDIRDRSGWIFLGVIAVATIIAYTPVLFNFFVGDDFVHLTWLKQAVQQPELIWRNFHSSWLDGTTTKFYRPLISVFMVTDYLTWGLNGLGFHLTNLCFHLAASLFLYLIVGELLPRDERFNRWPVAAAAVFALYPLHPEAVSWITGRVDSIVTAFSLASIWLYMKWSGSVEERGHLARNDSGLSPAATIKQGGILCLSLITFVLGLLSKEMAITVPAVLVVYEVFGNGVPKRTVFKTIPFWILIVGYFLVRQKALGTMVGGYDDSLLFIADVKAFVLNWVHALRMTVVPLNKELVGAHHWLTKSWEVGLAIAVTLSAASFIKNKQYRGSVLFLLGWLVLSLFPVYKIFAISDDLQGSRLAYLATAPLAVLLTFGISTMFHPRLRAALATGFAALCAIALWTNNQPWRNAGLESNAIRSALETIYAGVDNDPQTLMVGLPDQTQGAYICRNALWGMMKRPQLSKDVQNCLMVNEFEPVQPFGFLKDSLIENRASVRVFQWLPGTQRFQRIELPAAPAPMTPIDLRLDGDVTELPVHKRPSQAIDCGQTPCWYVDFVRIDLNMTALGTTPVGADLLYANEISPEFKLAHRAHADVRPGNSKQSLLFSLRSLPEWALGGKGARLKLLLPPGCKATVDRAVVVPHTVLMPELSFGNSGYMGTKGYLHLGKSAPQGKIFVDSHLIPGATAAALEITRANLLFEEQNGTHFSKVARPLLACPLTGAVQLSAKEFTSPGIYEARIWAKDEANNVIGVSSDHIVLSVDP